MNDDTYNPADLLFLASRALDETLADEEQRRLDTALRESPPFAAEVAKLRSVSGLVSRWSKCSPEIDWETHADLIHADVSGENDPDNLAAVDSALSAWGKQQIEMDEDAFATAVMSRIAPVRVKRSVSRMIFRLGTPLAAAAVIALAVLLRSLPIAPQAVSFVSIGPRVGMQVPAGDPNAPARTIVSFARVETSHSPREGGGAAFGFLSIGASTPSVGTDDGAPL